MSHDLRRIYEDMEASSRANTQARKADLGIQKAQLAKKSADLAKQSASLTEDATGASQQLAELVKVNRLILAELVKIRQSLA